MTLYLDVGMVRVQKYLGRWPQLRGRRAASSIAAGTFEWNAIEPVVGTRASHNIHAADIDGKISLIVEGDDADAVARDVLAYARRKLPAGEFEATYARADSYNVAYDLIAAKRDRGDSIVSLATGVGFPAFKPCDLCAQSPATEVVVNANPGEDEPRSVCIDCRARIAHQNAPPQHAKGAAVELAKKLGFETLPKDFEQLAKLGPADKQNHLACVFADGNAFGSFFQALAKSDPGLVPDLSVKIGEHTKQALECAARTIQGSANQPRTLVHLLGGDDVLVSVPAPLGWAFTTDFLEQFCELVDTTIAEIRASSAAADAALPARSPTASAAIVFSHSHWPFDQAAELAAKLLKRSKGVVGGAEASIAWIDVTRRGVDHPLVPISLADLNQRVSSIEAIAGWDPSTVGRLSQIINSEPAPVAKLKIERTLRRHGHLSSLPVDDLAQLEQLIDIAHWWSTS